MDIKAYIESGILELYVMEALSPQEMREVEVLAVQYPAVKAEIAQIQDALNEYVLVHANKSWIK
jgi:predicted dinucleotide-binding enzyme